MTRSKPESDFVAIVAAAEQVLSRTWNQPVRLVETAPLTEKGRRNVVLRCRSLSANTPSSVIIKHVVADNA
jgi:hypothetical protein